jgi:hypothetical protein
VTSSWFLTIFIYSFTLDTLSVEQRVLPDKEACEAAAVHKEAAPTRSNDVLVTTRCTELVWGTERKLLETM